jgi:hypothetical protein
MVKDSKLSETEVLQIAVRYAESNGVNEPEVSRISFVDAATLPERLKQNGSFWIIGFSEPSNGETVAEHDGLVLNVRDADGEVTMI